MAQRKQNLLTVRDYLQFERSSPVRHDFYQGEIYALAGSSEAHNIILSNIIITIGGQLRKRPCRIYPSDLRVRIPNMNIYTYPDASIVCGTPLFDDAERDTLLNPLMIIEILSPSTERYDRGKKFHHYQTIATLKEYMLIAQDEHRIEHYTKHDDDTWRFSTYTTLQASIPIPTIQCTIALEDIYDKVDIESISDEDDLPINNEEQP